MIHAPPAPRPTTHSVLAHGAATLGCWLLLGPAAGIAAAVVVGWARLGRPTPQRVLGLASLLLTLMAVGWLAAGSPGRFGVATFLFTGGREWIDALGRAAIGVAAMAPLVDEGTRRPTLAPHRRLDRLPEADRLRAVAITAVLLIHGLPYRPPVTDYIDYWLSDVLRFSVAVFFFVSGWLLPREPVGRDWLRRRLLRLLPPYLAASVLMMGLARVTDLIDARPVWQSLLLGDSVGPYYFVFVLTTLTVATPLLLRLPRAVRRALLLLSVVGGLVIELADLSIYLHNHLPLTWLPYYLAGFELRPRRERIARLGDGQRATLLLLTTAGVAALAFAPIETPVRRGVTYVVIWLMVATLLALTSADGMAQPTPLVRRLGRESYFIYLYHVPIVAAIAGALGSSILSGRPLVAVAVALVVCTVAASLVRMTWPGTAARWLGA